MSKSHFSLKDVAKEAEVSSTTISRYLNGTLRLPDSTSDRINKAVKKLRYHPNPHARRLSLGKSEQIALILPDLANPFFAKLAASIERAAAEYGSMVSLHATSNKDLRELAALRCAADDRVESLIFMTNRLPSKEVAEELSNFKRVVLLDEDVPGVSAETPGTSSSSSTTRLKLLSSSATSLLGKRLVMKIKLSTLSSAAHLRAANSRKSLLDVACNETIEPYSAAALSIEAASFAKKGFAKSGKINAICSDLPKLRRLACGFG